MLKANGLEVVGWYYDEGVSGTVPIATDGANL
jgi:hypothetical protein